MDPFIECVGDPRAMGHCQGLAHRALIQQRVVAAGGKIGRSRWPTLRALTSGSDLGRGAGREVIRHYTHLAERMAGIARNADVSFSSLMELFNTSTGGAAPDDELVAEAVALGVRRMENAKNGPVIVRTLSGASFDTSPWILRRSRPEVGFASAEITLPWLATAVAGINESGVAVAIAPRSESYGGGVTAGAVNARNAPHAVLLVQECLQRFEDIEGCLDWCRKRPRSGNVSLMIADAAGHLARIEVEGVDCTIAEIDADFALDGAPPEVDEELRSHLRDHQQIDLAALSAIGESVDQLAVWLEPIRRKLTIRSIGDVESAGKAIEIAV
ncbi:MAG: hypothetical protein IH881_04690 [Myxococcales bacterium]|nr:hypothetical protein [Myxococcales bacterium]